MIGNSDKLSENEKIAILEQRIKYLEDENKILKSKSLKYVRSLSGSDDMDNIIDPGLYSISSDVSLLIKNLELREACVIEVLDGGPYIVQIQYGVVNNRKRFRKSDKTWNGWRSFQ